MDIDGSFYLFANETIKTINFNNNLIFYAPY